MILWPFYKSSEKVEIKFEWLLLSLPHKMILLKIFILSCFIAFSQHCNDSSSKEYCILMG